MTGIQIKIAGEWMELPEDFSISLEQSSPLFNDEGIFSFPFEIPMEPNRKIFKNVDDPFGDITLSDIDRMEAEIWFDGVMLYRGIIETDEEIEFEDTIPVTFLSGNSDFKTRIEGMNLKDVPLDREIKLGYVVTDAQGVFNLKAMGDHIDLDSYVFVGVYFPNDDLMDFTEYNVSDPYPIKPYCNVRVCTPGDQGGYVTLDAKRPRSGMCFYVLYIIDCLLKHLGIGTERNDMLEMEDMCRLAFFSTKCGITRGESNGSLSIQEMRRVFGLDFDLYHRFGLIFDDYYPGYIEMFSNNFIYNSYSVYTTNESLPDISFEDVFNDLKNAFGVRWIYDEKAGMISFVFVKDILRNNEITVLDAEILETAIKREKSKKIVFGYGEEDDTAYTYTDYSNVKEMDNYLAILQQGVASNDTTCYIDRKTGNAYRIKVDKNTGGNPALFEVGGFRNYSVGEGSDDDTEEISVNFRPVTINDTLGAWVVYMAQLGKEFAQSLTVFADTELLSDNNVSLNLTPSVQGYIGATANGHGIADIINEATLTYKMAENYDRTSGDTPPLASYDAGYTLGVMRGPGNDSGIEYVRTNYDGEGNDSWVQTAALYSFTADSCDNFGRFFDYNGTQPGGVDHSEQFSLKLIAGKDGYPIGDEYKDRGLVAKFQSEYLYFMAHKKTVVLTVKMNITQIIGIDFLKRYKIGDYVGFINKVSYTLTNYGMEDVTIELYTL